MKNKIVFICCMALMMTGCARLWEAPRSIWGSSTRALESVRDAALARIYSCDFEQCFNDALDLAQDKGYHVFLQSEPRKVIVLMKIPESIDTTEVGVFFEPLEPQKTSVEVVSLSIRAKETVSRNLFAWLDQKYPVIE